MQKPPPGTQNIKYVPMGDNNINWPISFQTRPIENFWANLCLKVHDKAWQAKTKTQLIRRIRNKLKDFDQKELQTLMKEIRQKLRKIADKGPYSVISF